MTDAGVEYYDYSLDKRFSRRYDLFMNGDHLNEDQARMFVDVLYEEIIENSGISDPLDES